MKLRARWLRHAIGSDSLGRTNRGGLRNVAVRRKISPSEYAYTRLISLFASVVVGFEGDVIERTDKPNHPVYDILRRTKLPLHTFA